MWRRAFSTMALAAVQPLAYYQSCSIPQAELGRDISNFVCDAMMRLPWYFRLPLIGIGTVVELLSSCLPRHPRHVWVQRLSSLPHMESVTKLVRTLALMRLFDHPEILEHPSS